jgi:RNA ligase (TIGR02306 family)
MSDFKCQVSVITIEKHPDPEVTAIEIGKIGDYNTIVKKGLFKTGDLVVYILEQSIVPENILSEMGLVGKLAGSLKNRVKPTKFRKVISQGLVYPSRLEWELNQDVSSLLGITKYEPPIPAQLRGHMQMARKARPNGSPVRLAFDIENLKRYPKILQEGEEVVFTEKIHGTWMGIADVPADLREPEMMDGRFFIGSKGLTKDGVYWKDIPENKSNFYVSTAKKFNLLNKLAQIRELLGAEAKDEDVIWLMGEAFGLQKGYGYGATSQDSDYRAFAIKVGPRYLNRDEFSGLCILADIKTAPLLYRGPFSMEKVKEFTSGKETITTKNLHIREGIVITPVEERYDNFVGRVCLKSVSDDYLMKSTGEEFN